MIALALFPRLDNTGGIQRAGARALEALVERCGSERIQSVQYDARRSRLRSVLETLHAARARQILVWHIDLLRLLPFAAPRGAETVLFLHGVECWRPLRMTERLLMPFVSRTISNSHHTWAQWVSHNRGAASLRNDIVHLGTGRSVGLRLPPSHIPTAVMLGRMEIGEDYKGHREVIRAWPAVLDQLGDARLVIVGDGTLRPALEQLAVTVGVSRAVEFKGAVSDVERDHLIESARCMLLPSRREGFGLAYVEAMRLGRPCLVSHCDAGREVVRPPEAGLAVDPSNGAALSASICRLLRASDEWEQWSRRSQELYDQEFTEQAFKHRFADAFLAG